MPVGALVRHQLSRREYAVAPASTLQVIDESTYPRLSLHIGFAMTAYVGLVDVAGMREGDTVYVSSAAGSVGGLAGHRASAGREAGVRERGLRGEGRVPDR